ncbi:MAG: LptF/LptG family permease [Planctomycetota bacterium]
MPWTLYAYILRELLKVLLLTTAILVTVMSFATAIKPLSDGLLGPIALFRFILFSLPTMIGFALPFAGTLAATLVFIRLANDNEVTAAAASGISYSRILLPVAALGLTCTLSLAYLSNAVVPWFYKQVAETLEGDVMSILVAQLNENRAFKFPGQDYVLYAENAREIPLDPQPFRGQLRLDKELQLTGVALGRMSADNPVRSDATAQEARVQLYRDKQGVGYVSVRLINPLVFDQSVGELQQQQGGSSQANLDFIELPNPIRDKPKFLSWSDLRQLENTPSRYDAVNTIMQSLAARLAEEELRQAITRGLTVSDSGQPAVWLNGPLTGERYRLTAPTVATADGLLLLAADPFRSVVIEKFDNDRPSLANVPVRTFAANAATLRITTSDLNQQPVVQATLNNVVISDPTSDGPANEDTQRELTGLTWPQPLLTSNPENPAAPTTNDARLLLQTAELPAFAQSETIQREAAVFRAQIASLGRLIVGLRHQRLASAVSCTLLLLLGATLAMTLRHQLPLLVFFWCFVLAITTTIIIHSGENLTGSLASGHIWPGLTVMWSGNLLLAVVIGIAYCKLAKH